MKDTHGLKDMIYKDVVIIGKLTFYGMSDFCNSLFDFVFCYKRAVVLLSSIKHFTSILNRVFKA